MKKSDLNLSSAIITFILCVTPVLSHAQTEASSGLSISPFLIELQATKGLATKETIYITNTSKRIMPVEITINDFYPSGTNGAPVFVAPGQGDHQYSLSDWIAIESNPKPILKPGEKTSLIFSVTPPKNAEEGGHYGGILFGFQGSDVSGSSVAVVQKIGAIILAKLGKVEEAGSATLKAEYSVSEHQPVNFFTTFENSGNVHVKPRGYISIYNMFGKKVGSVLVNGDANNVLPSNQRQFLSTWKGGYAFGFFNAKAEIAYGDGGQIIIASTSFWVVPWKAAAIGAFIIFLVLVLLRSLVRKYNCYIVQKSNSRK